MSRLRIWNVAIIASFIFVSIVFAQANVERKWVNGYFKNNGTYVRGFWRTAPDSNPYNNFNTPGNYNPNTGEFTKGDLNKFIEQYYRKQLKNTGAWGTLTPDPALRTTPMKTQFGPNKMRDIFSPQKPYTAHSTVDTWQFLKATPAEPQVQTLDVWDYLYDPVNVNPYLDNNSSDNLVPYFQFDANDYLIQPIQPVQPLQPLDPYNIFNGGE